MFCMKMIIKGRQHVRFLLLVRCGQLCLSSHQIAGFFKYQNQWKELSDPSFPLSGNNSHQEKVVFKTTTLGWVLPGMLIHQSDFSILWVSISLEKSIDTFVWPCQFCLFVYFLAFFIKYSRALLSYHLFLLG